MKQTNNEAIYSLKAQDLSGEDAQPHSAYRKFCEEHKHECLVSFVLVKDGSTFNWCEGTDHEYTCSLGFALQNVDIPDVECYEYLLRAYASGNAELEHLVAEYSTWYQYMVQAITLYLVVRNADGTVKDKHCFTNTAGDIVDYYQALELSYTA